MGAYEIRKSAAERVGYPLSDLGVMEAAMRCQHCDPGGVSVTFVIPDLFRTRLWVVSESGQLGSKRYEQPPREDG